MKNISFVLPVFIFVLTGTTSLKAQLNVGSSNPPNPDAALQVSSPASNKGILFPLVLLTATTNASPLTAHVQGMVVYNTATVADVSPGIYYNDGTKWVALTGGSSTRTDVIRGALVNGANSTDLANYDAASANSVINISLASYNAIQGLAGATTILESNSFMAGTPYSGSISNSNFTTSIPAGAFAGTYFSGGQYMVAFQIKNKGFNSGANDQGAKIKFASTVTGPYTDYCNSIPNVPLTANYTSRYYVIKTPTNAIPPTPIMAIYASPTWKGDQIGGSTGNTVSCSSVSGDGKTLAANSNTITSNIYIQAIEIPTKQW